MGFGRGPVVNPRYALHPKSAPLTVYKIAASATAFRVDMMPFTG